jgi:hypothetical protein
MKPVPLTWNQKVCMQGAPAGALPTIQGHGMGHHQVREVEPGTVTVTPRFPVIPHVGEDTRYEPPGSRKVATPALSVRDERLVLVEVTLTSALATGNLGVPPPGVAGPPASITVTLSVPDFPL